MSSSADIMLHMDCPACDADLLFQCTGPDYDVGIMGYACGLVDPEYRDCQCLFTDEERDALEYEAAERLTWNVEEPL